MRCTYLLVIAAGCGFSLQPGGSADPVDAPAGDGVVDVAIDAVPLGPFSNIVPLTPLNTIGGEDDPTLTGDMLEIYFDRGSDIWFSTRTSVTAPWSAPQALAVVNTGSSETTSEITVDGLELFFSSNRGGGMGGTDIYVSSRPDRVSAFTTPVHLLELASSGEDVTPTVVGTGLVMYLSSTRGGGTGGYDLYRAARPNRAMAWSTPINVTSAATTGTETEPWVDPTETSLYLSGDGLGGRDLWLSTRPTPASAWEPRVAITELNSAGSEEDPWLSPDGRTMIFASTRSGNFELYMATR